MTTTILCPAVNNLRIEMPEMHEMSICLALLRQVGEVAENNGAESVEKITVLVGPLSGVEPLMLENAFSIARAGTIAEKARLVCEAGEIKVSCQICGAESMGSINSLICEQCKSWKTTVLSGYDLILKNIELKKAD